MAKPVGFIGIDPGAKGAICLLNPATREIAFKDTTDNPLELLKWFGHINKLMYLPVIMIEDVHAIFGTSAKSNFNFGYNVGVVNTIGLAAGNSVMRVTPKKWQKHMGVKGKGKDIKHDVARICLELYPNSKSLIYGPQGGLKDGRSDALMVAHYASQTFNTHQGNK